ncbi:MAG: DNA primase [Betaproteobacteria bacterium]|nr:DNA primase [Betaproteobacteria bacterium]
MIPDSFKQDLLNRVDIVEVVSRYVRLKKAGANFQGLCPFHNEKTPSFSVSPTKQFYHCFGCGVHGNAIGFLMAYGGMGYVDAVKDLASSVGMQMPEFKPRTKEEIARDERQTDLYGVMEKAMDFYRAELKKSPQAIEYLKGRGLTGEIAARFRMGYAPDDWQALKAVFPEYEDKSLVECGLVIENEGKRYDRFRGRVMFPILNARGAVIGFGGRVIGEGEPKYLNSPETPLFEKGREVYGLVQARDAIRQASRVLVVEGYMDVVALAQFGVGYAVATLGTATTPVHVQKLLRLADEIVFSFDGDAAGRKAAWRALEVSLPLAPDDKPIRFLFLPDGEDPDTYIRKHGQEAFERLVGEAQTLSEFLFAELRGQFSLSSPEGRSQFIAAAKPHLQKITAPALRIQLLKEAARLSELTAEEAERLLGRPEEAPVYRRPAPAKKAFAAPTTPEWKVLCQAVAWPAVLAEIDLALLDANLPESRALHALSESVQESPASGAMLIERLQNGAHAELVFAAQADAASVAETEEGARLEVRHALWKMEINRKNGAIKLLGEKLRQGKLSKEEHVRYGRMITEVKALEQRLQVEGRTASIGPASRQ